MRKEKSEKIKYSISSWIMFGAMFFLAFTAIKFIIKYTEVDSEYKDFKDRVFYNDKWATEAANYKVIAHHLVTEFPYDREGYNCVDFSYELVRRLSTIGKDAEVVAGFVKDGHAWVKCYNCEENKTVVIEATSGTIVNQEYYEMYYIEDEEYQKKHLGG